MNVCAKQPAVTGIDGVVKIQMFVKALERMTIPATNSKHLFLIALKSTVSPVDFHCK